MKNIQGTNLVVISTLEFENDLILSCVQYSIFYSIYLLPLRGLDSKFFETFYVVTKNTKLIIHFI